MVQHRDLAYLLAPNLGSGLAGSVGVPEATVSLAQDGAWAVSVRAEETGAGDGDRTHDIKLGKLAFYH